VWGRLQTTDIIIYLPMPQFAPTVRVLFFLLFCFLSVLAGWRESGDALKGSPTHRGFARASYVCHLASKKGKPCDVDVQQAAAAAAAAAASPDFPGLLQVKWAVERTNAMAD
jgi:hypothetical protein